MGHRVSRRHRFQTFYRVLAFVFAYWLFLPTKVALAQPTTQPNPGKSPAQAATHLTPVLDATLTLRVYNYARLDAASLAASEKVAGAILEKVGIKAIWVDCPTSKANSRAYPACDLQMGTTDLILRILPRSMAVKLRRSNDSLGSAQTCPEIEPACELNVFYHRIDELAAKGYRADRILGYVMAHEMAHVLVGPAHSEEGIMRAGWTTSDLQYISLGLSLGFSNDQSGQLRRAVLRRAASPAEENSFQANLIPQ